MFPRKFENTVEKHSSGKLMRNRKYNKIELRKQCSHCRSLLPRLPLYCLPTTLSVEATVRNGERWNVEGEWWARTSEAEDESAGIERARDDNPSGAADFYFVN